MNPERLKQARKRVNHSQQSLGDVLGIAGTQVSRWERGETSPSSYDLSRLADALDTSTDYLMGRTDDPRPVSEIIAGRVHDNTRRVLEALERGDKLEAVRIIVTD